MADYTLNKFGVPINGGKQGPIPQPKRKYNFRARFLNLGFVGNQATAITLNLDTVTFPSISHESVEINAYNSKAYYAGKHTWSSCEMTVRDTVDNSVTRNIDAQLQRQLDHYNQTGFRSATDYKFTTIIEMMDGGDDAVLESWTLEGCFFENVAYGDGSYSDSSYKTINMTVRMDNCTHVDEAGNRLMADPGADPLSTTL